MKEDANPGGAMPLQNTEELVERQLRLWKEQSFLERQFVALPGSERGPVIAVSREHGALGARIARQVAQRLDFAYYDREIIEQIASTARVREAVVESVDARVRNRIGDWVAGVFGGERMSGSTYVRHLSSVLMSIAYHGGAVIVGRGACFLLDPASTLRVRAYAPLEVRVARVAESHHLTVEEARADVVQTDASRVRFGRRYFDRDVNDAGAYDLMVDTGRIPAEVCAQMVEMAFLGRFSREPIAW